MEKVLKRTVYTRDEIDAISSGGCLVLLFSLQGQLPKSIGIAQLEEIRIRAPRDFTVASKIGYKAL